MKGKFQSYGIPLLLLILLLSYSVLALLSPGTIGGADDITHFKYSRYAFQHPSYFLHHWGKPFFTALSAPFAQFGFPGIKIFNVLAGITAAWFTYRTAVLFKLKFPVVAIFLVISAPMYSMLMLSGMTEILFSLVLIVSIFLFFNKQYIWSALLLSFIPFVRNEGVVIFPLFLVAYVWQREWKAIPFLLTGLLFYSIVGSFHFKDILWVFHEMPYTGEAKELYGSGSLFYYVRSSKLTLGLGLTLMALLGGLAWLLDPFVRKEADRKPWILQMLVGYLPFMVYFVAHSYVWWKGLGNSVGMIRVIAAVVPSAALLGTLGWSRLMELLPLSANLKRISTLVLCLFLLTLPHQMYEIPYPLKGEQEQVDRAARWLKQSEYQGGKVYYYDPFFWYYLDLNPMDEERSRAFLHNNEHPAYMVPEGSIVIWDAHYGPNEGQLPLSRLMDHPGFRLIQVFRPEESFIVLGNNEYEIYLFRRITSDDGEDNQNIYKELLEEILNPQS
jgi:hypothetical protein